MRPVRPLAILVLTMTLASCITASSADRRTEMEWLNRTLPKSPAFEQWTKDSGELPPDFARLPSNPFLEDPLTVTRDGQPRHVTAADWPARRAEIAGRVEQWLVGHAPPPPAPGSVRGIIEKKDVEGTSGGGGGREVWTVRLEFGPEGKAILTCWFYPAKRPGRAPVFLCDNKKYAHWADRAADAGGFALCVYNACDPVYSDDKKDQSEAYADLFGKYDWSAFRRRGWSASRAVDWLVTLDNVDPQRIYIGGHSRSAKQAMVGAAFDPRIAGVIASSPGSGGSMPYRYYDESLSGESAELLTRVFPDWVSHRVRFFVGREQKLPADSHLLYALLAPRPVLMSTAVNDWVESTWTAEQVYRASQPVYALLGQPGNLALRYRPGQHPADDATARAYSDWLMLVAGVGGSTQTPAELFPFQPYHPWDYAAWAKAHAASIDPARRPERAGGDPTVDEQGQHVTQTQWPQRRAAIREQIAWLLGDGPEYEPLPVQWGSGESDAEAKVLMRDKPAPPAKVKVRFGQGVNGNVYYPKVAVNTEAESPVRSSRFSVSSAMTPATTSSAPTADTLKRELPTTSPAGNPAYARKLPGVVWLAPFQCSSGYVAQYKSGDRAFERLAAAGFVVLAFDPLGTGGRQEERRDFYARHPRWSLLGKMVLDARHAVDALAACPEVDPRRIYLVGYALGGQVALYAAALDERVAGVVSIAGCTPYRTDRGAAAAETGGLRVPSELFGWLPRLGPFNGYETRVPVDFDEILACAAPRPALVIAPQHDRHATHAHVVAAVEAARKAYALLGAEGKLALQSPDDYNRLTTPMEDAAIEWLKAQGR